MAPKIHFEINWPLIPIVSWLQTKRNKHKKNKKLALNNDYRPIKFWQTMLRCSFCVFLILLLLYVKDPEPWIFTFLQRKNSLLDHNFWTPLYLLCMIYLFLFPNYFLCIFGTKLELGMYALLPLISMSKGKKVPLFFCQWPPTTYPSKKGEIKGTQQVCPH